MTPQLYIEIDHIVKSGQSGTQALSHMLMGNNPGLPFLTKLKLTLARGRPNEEWSMQSQPVRELLLMHIRPNQLKELLIFDDPENGFRVQNLTLDELANILNKQRDLIRLTIGLFAAADCKHIARAAVPKIVPLLTKITAIELKARDDECEAFHLAAMLISQNRQIIEDLVIKAGDVDGLPDPVGYPQTLEHLEDHYNDLTPHPTLSLPFQNLKSSSSSALYWGLAEDSWLALFGCTTLQSLRLRNRDQVSTFLEQLAEAYRATGTCNLRTLEITWNMDVISEPIAIRQALHELLLTFKGLRRLFIVSHCSETNASVVSLPAVLRHAATLESLIIEEIDRKPFTTDTMGDLCRKCPNLRHLGLDLPLSDADATLGGGEFGQYLTALGDASKLESLSIRRWLDADVLDPYDFDDQSSLGSYEDRSETYRKMLRSFAFGLFTYFLKKWKSRTLGAIRMGGHALETYVDCLEHELKPEMYQCLIINRQWWRQLIKTLKIRRISDHSLISTVDDTITLGVKVKRPWH